MAVKFNTLNGGAISRNEFFLLDPNDIRVDSKASSRGRHFNPTKEQVAALAASMADPKIGQQNPIVCRRDADKVLSVVSGYTRLEAAKLIRETDPQFRIKVTVAVCSEEEAVVRNIAENAIRAETSAIDDAHNHRRLMEQYGKTPEEVAEIYGYPDTRKITRLSRLLELPEKAQRLVHTQQLTVTAALDILDIPSQEGRSEALTNVYDMTADGKKAKSRKVRETARAAIIGDDDSDEVVAEEEVADKTVSEQAVASDSEEAVEPSTDKPVKVASKARLLRDVNDFVKELQGEEQHESLQELGKALGLWISGKKTTRFLFKKLHALMNIED